MIWQSAEQPDLRVRAGIARLAGVSAVVERRDDAVAAALEPSDGAGLERGVGGVDGREIGQARSGGCERQEDDERDRDDQQEARARGPGSPPVLRCFPCLPCPPRRAVAPRPLSYDEMRMAARDLASSSSRTGAPEPRMGAGRAGLAARYRSLFVIGRGGMGTVEAALELQAE